MGHPPRAALTRAVDTLAIGVVAFGLAVLALRLTRGITGPGGLVTVILVLAVGYLLADLMTGTVHWFCDTFFEETTPLFGRILIVPFREHHRDPLALTRHGLWELNGNSCIALAPLLVFFVGVDSARPSLALEAVVFAIAGAAAATNVFHRWAHDPAPPKMARRLHRLGIVLTPSRHARHHVPPYRASYCVTSGWMNAALDQLKVFDRAEVFLANLGLPAPGRSGRD